jgi:hypothetical protein
MSGVTWQRNIVTNYVLTNHPLRQDLAKRAGFVITHPGAGVAKSESFCGIDFQADTPGLIGRYADATWSLTGVDAAKGGYTTRQRLAIESVAYRESPVVTHLVILSQRCEVSDGDAAPVSGVAVV